MKTNLNFLCYAFSHKALVPTFWDPMWILKKLWGWLMLFFAILFYPKPDYSYRFFFNKLKEYLKNYYWKSLKTKMGLRKSMNLGSVSSDCIYMASLGSSLAPPCVAYSNAIS